MTGLVGQQLGNYRLLRLLGAGGFAEVYLGEHVYLNTQAAIKVLQTRLAQEDRERFLHEARLIARLVHPHIVRVLEFGVEAEVPFLVMDYAPNGTLRSRLPRGTPLAPESILPYVQQVADALHYAHAQGLVHRDVKPENMLLGREDEVLLSDFGIALIAQSTRLENAQEVFGTASYMAPEQIQGKAGPASDQYALAVVLYEWLCGELPFHGSFTELCSQHLFTPPPPLREQVPGISPAVESVVEKALAKQPGQRFPDVLALASALEEACQAEQPADTGLEPTVRRSNQPTLHESDLPAGDGQHPQGSSIPPTQAVHLYTPELPVLPTLPAALSRPKRVLTRRAVLIGAGAAGLAAAGGGVWLLLSHRKATPSASTTRFTSPPSPSPSASFPVLGTTLLTYRGHTGAVYGAAWSPGGRRIASGSTDKTVRLWDATTGKDTYVYRAHSDIVFVARWSPTGPFIASGGADATVRVWQAS